MSIPSKAPNVVLKKGSKGENVKTLQEILIELNYSCGKAGVDGNFGANTDSAVRKFQKENLLQVDGHVGPQTWAMLYKKHNAFVAQTKPQDTTLTVIRRGATGQIVKDLQTKLTELGYPCGAIDGSFGSLTYAAVKKFQKDHGLEADGVVGPLTSFALSKAEPNKAETYKPVENPNGEFTVSKLLEIARNEIGYYEKATNSNLYDKTANAGHKDWTKYAKELSDAGYFGGANKNGYAWCASFVCWCFWTMTNKDIKKAKEINCQRSNEGAGCSATSYSYNAAGRWHTKNPKPGDQIFFGKGLGDLYHTGIVESVSDTTITTIEGNNSDMVVRKSYAINSSKIAGFGSPRYSEEVKASDNKVMSNVLYTVQITANSLNVRKSATTNSEIVGVLSKADKVDILEVAGEWGRTNNGWINLTYTEEATDKWL